MFQKFTCEACLARQTMDTPNAFYTSGKCDECGHITQLKTGCCGFMLVQSADPVKHKEFVEMLTESIRAAQPRNRN